MSLMTELNEIALSLWVGLDYFFFPAYMAIGERATGTTFVLAGTLTDSRLVILRVLIFSQRLCQRLLMLWVILFFYFGVLNLRAISSVDPTWRTLEFCGAPRGFRSNWFHASPV